MRINRRSFQHTVAAAAAGLLLGVSATAAVAQDSPLRSGKTFTSTNNAAGNELLVLGNAPDGTPALLARVQTLGLGTSSGLGSQGAVTLSGDGRWLFVVNAGSNSISTFALRGGAPVLVSVTDSAGLRPISVSEHDGLVYVLNADGAGNVAGFRNQNGTLSAVAGSVRPLSAAGGTAPAQVSIGTEGDVLVVTEKNTSKLTSYALAADGSAGAPVVTASAGATPFGFAFDRRNHALVTEAGASTFSSYGFAGAVPTVISASVPTNQGAACWAAVTPNGRYAYTGNAASNSLSLFAIDRTGAVTLLAAAAASTGADGGAGDIAIAGHGRTLSVLAPKIPAVVNFAVAADGSLTLTGSVSGLPAGVVGLAAN